MESVWSCRAVLECDGDPEPELRADLGSCRLQAGCGGGCCAACLHLMLTLQTNLCLDGCCCLLPGSWKTCSHRPGWVFVLRVLIASSLSGNEFGEAQLKQTSNLVLGNTDVCLPDMSVSFQVNEQRSEAAWGCTKWKVR